VNARKPRTGTLHERMVPRDVVRVLRAELDDDAAVAAWLSGGAK
jgi:hypothetical protein